MTSILESTSSATTTQSCSKCGASCNGPFCAKCEPRPSETGVSYSTNRISNDSTFAAVPHPYARKGTAPPTTEIPRAGRSSAIRLAPHLIETRQTKPADGRPSWFPQNRGTTTPATAAPAPAPAPQKIVVKPPAATVREKPEVSPTSKAEVQEATPPKPAATPPAKTVEPPTPAAAAPPPQPKPAAQQPTRQPSQPAPPIEDSQTERQFEAMKAHLETKLRLAGVLKERVEEREFQKALSKFKPEQREELQNLANDLAELHLDISTLFLTDQQ